ncbi:MAG: hypothetical protein ACOY5R_06645 [Pseudomonadota bacterium]
MRLFIDGKLKAIPAVTDATYGDPLLPTERAAVGTGVILYLAAGETVTFAVDTQKPTGTVDTVTLTGPGRFDEPLGPKSNLWVLSFTGAPKFRQL